MPGLKDGSHQALAIFAKMGMPPPLPPPQSLHNPPKQYGDEDDASSVSSFAASEVAMLNPGFVSKCEAWLLNKPYTDGSCVSAATPPSKKRVHGLVAYTPSSSVSTRTESTQNTFVANRLSAQKTETAGRVLLDNSNRVKRKISFSTSACASLPPKTHAAEAIRSVTDDIQTATPVLNNSSQLLKENAFKPFETSKAREEPVPKQSLGTIQDISDVEKGTGDAEPLSPLKSGKAAKVSKKKHTKTLGIARNRVNSTPLLSSGRIQSDVSDSEEEHGSPSVQESAATEKNVVSKPIKKLSSSEAPENTRQLRKRALIKYDGDLNSTDDDELFVNGSDGEDTAWTPEESESVQVLQDTISEHSDGALIGNSVNNESSSEAESLDAEPEKVKKSQIKAERRRLRNSGMEYKSARGKLVKARACQPLPRCKAAWCKINQLSEEDRQSIFQEYWSLGDYNKRAQYVSSRIIKNPTKTHKQKENEAQKNRTCTLEYSLIHNEQRITVSKGCFLATLDENDRFVRGILERRSNSGQTPDDLRGKHAPKNKFPEEVRQEVVSHIKKFPAYVSHYSRRHTEQLYLGSHLNVSIMHKMFLEEGGTHMSYNTYLDIFNSMRPRLKFKSPHVDTCVTCDSYQNSIQAAQSPDEKGTLQQQFDLHVKKADFAYACKKADRQAAKDSSNKKVLIVFDLQQVLPCPYLTSGNVFYLRQLSVYNLTVFQTTLKKAYNFMWHEAIGGRGADEIASCLITFINEFIPLSVKHLILYSDTCSGQNKNSLMLSALTLTVQQHPSIEIIDQKFLVSGHTHLECDQAHHQIETKKKKTNVALHHPQNYYDLVKEVGPTQKKFVVREMEQRDIFNFELTVKGADAPLVWRKTDTDGNPFLFSEAEWFRVEKSSPGIILYKKSLREEEPFISINWKRKRNVPLPEIDLMQKRNKLCAISAAKKKDLLSMLGQINPLYHEFYKTLPCDSDVVDEDPDLPPEFDVANEFE